MQLGGQLLAWDPDHEQGGETLEDLGAGLRTLVAVGGDHVWPVVTLGARRCTSGDRPDVALREVHAVLSDVARAAPGTTGWFDGSMTRTTQCDLRLVRDLALALTTRPEEVTLAYQPIVDLRDGRTVGAEALLRWEHGERGTVPPLDAVRAAERSGQVRQLGRLVMDRALGQLADWDGHLAESFRLHVNVSPLELRDPGYAADVAHALDRYGVAPQRLLLELTETASMTAEPAICATLDLVAALGVGIGVDDFGAGYSTLEPIRGLPVGTVKVDRSLIRGIATSPADFSIARTLLTLLASSGLTVIAEGIEDAVTAAHLRAAGCALAQGFHLGRPAKHDEFLRRFLRPAGFPPEREPLVVVD